MTLSQQLTGLTPGLVYHYRVVATNSPWPVLGADQTFWIPAVSLNSANPLTNECHVPFVDLTTINASPLAIAAGGMHNLALKADGTVVGWGNNNFGQTNGALAGSNVVAIAAGSIHGLALRADGTVVGWGYNSYGQTNGALAGSNVVAIAAGFDYNLALKADGTVVGWGNNLSGQTNGARAGSNVVAIAAGGGHSLALKADGTVIGWGRNDYGQTNGAQAGSNVVAIAAGGGHSLALKADGTVVGWGSNSSGQTNGALAGSNVVAIAAGSGHSLALRTDGTVVGWGNNSYGQANGALAGSNVVAIAAGDSFSLALRADGTIVGWGRNFFGSTNVPAGVNRLNLPIAASGTVDANVPGSYELTYRVTNALGAVSTATRTVVVADTQPPVLTLLGDNPVFLNTGTPYTEPGATATDLCAGDLTGSIVANFTVNPNHAGVYTNSYTVTDASGNTAHTTRTVVIGSPFVLTRTASDLVNYAVTLNATVNPNGLETAAWFEWGISTRYGNATEAMDLGNGTNGMPVWQQLNGLTPGNIYHYRAVATNGSWLARGTDQTFWFPALSLNSANPLTNECHLPFVDPTTVNASPLAIATGFNHSLALKADGTVIGWGDNGSGQTNGASAGANVVAIAAGGYHNLALRADGTVVGWGDNTYGQTNGALAGSNVVAIAAGGYHCLALKADGTVVGWGSNSSGQTNGALAGSSVVAIAAGYYHSLALKADGTVVGWGDNTYGQANGAQAGTNVVAIAAGYFHSLALKADGTVIGWGRNNYGQAHGAPAGSNIVAIAAGVNHNLALRADGIIVGWGWDNVSLTNGALAGANVVAMVAGANQNLALRADGTLVSWGRNDYGQTNVPADLNNLNLPIAVSGTLDVNVPGTYELAYCFTNALGAIGTATRTVVVADTQPPVLTLLGGNPLMHPMGTPYADPGVTATDLCGGNFTASIVSNLTVSPNLAGVYTNTYTVTDANGNRASTNRLVLVVTAPLSVGCMIAAPGQFRLHGPGIAGLTYTVQVSTNLADWVDHASVAADPDGLLDYVEEMNNGTRTRYYRLKWP